VARQRCPYHDHERRARSRRGSVSNSYGGGGTCVARTDQPSEADGVDLRALPEPSGEREVLRRRLERLPPGHPSSPIQDHDSAETTDLPAADRADEQARDDRPTEDTDRRPLTDAEHAEHVTEVWDLLDKAAAEGLATELQHTTDEDHEQWTEERVVLQDAIIADMQEAARDVPCDRRALLAGGLPGAGKTTVLEQQAGVDRSRYLTINPDDVKVQMAKRGMIPEVVGLTPMEASQLVHEESSVVAKRLARRAMREGKNLIWDITMSSRESTEKRINDLQEFGYSRVEAVFVDIPVEVAIRRADGRYREDHDIYRSGQGLGGRFVPAEVISAQADPQWGSCNRKTFEEVKPRLDTWARYDNSVDGRAAVLADSSSIEEEKR
jgi:predicted kinase